MVGLGLNLMMINKNLRKKNNVHNTLFNYKILLIPK